METIAWILLAVLGSYLFYRWSVLAEVRDELRELVVQQKLIAEKMSDSSQLARQATDIQINIQGIRRKLGFDNEWATERHLEDCIESLQCELKRMREIAK